MEHLNTPQPTGEVYLPTDIGEVPVLDWETLARVIRIRQADQKAGLTTPQPLNAIRDLSDEPMTYGEFLAEK